MLNTKIIIPTQPIICKININNKEYYVKPNEFNQKLHPTYTKLFLIDKLGQYERIISLLKKLSLIINNDILCFNISHGGFIPINCYDNYKNIYCFIQDNVTEICIKKNSNLHNITTKLNINTSLVSDNDSVIFLENNYKDSFNFSDNIFKNYILVCKNTLKNIRKFTNIYSIYYPLKESDFTIYIPEKYIDKFKDIFQHYLINNELCYDNLVNLTMIVKNAGDEFENILLKNFPYIDSWTILDTGSTDNTINIINKVLIGKKPGKLYQEPFINFRDTRNRCLELANNDNDSKFTLMLDDTYTIIGNFRETLNILRNDQYANSYSIYIRNNDIEYISNRLIRTDSNLRYIYKIHEIITDENNINVCISLSDFYIFDEQNEYMLSRSINRKQFDLTLLLEMLEEDPNNPRHLYYIAQTYMTLENWEKAYEYFMKRIEFKLEGYIQEKIDSYFEAARLCNFKLKKDWKYCKELYLKAYELDSTRPESLYFIGLHYYFENNDNKEYNYEQAYYCLRKAFELGYPVNAQYNLKLAMNYYFLPKYLVELCYKYNNSELGLKACERFFSVVKNINDENYNYMKSWKNIFECLILLKPSTEMLIPTKPVLCFICDGGFSYWSASTMYNKGLGGSETFIVEMSKYIQSFGYYDVIVFCKCDNNEVIEGVRYINILELFHMLPNIQIDTCIVSRYTEYLALASKLNIKHIYFSLHDLGPTGTIIPLPKNCHKILCLSEWHVNYFISNFPLFKNLTESFGYGIDHNMFDYNIKKIPFKFIYSSFANRGLLILLQMWPAIISLWPEATLDIFIDLNNLWLVNNHGEQVNKIKKLLEQYPESMNIINHGWIDKITLYKEYWSKADIWLYPCTFMETFCHTALEAAASKTLIITNDLAALPETVSDYGYIIKGNPNESIWQEQVIDILKSYYNNSDKFKQNIEKNYQRTLNLTWKQKAEEFSKKYLSYFEV